MKFDSCIQGLFQFITRSINDRASNTTDHEGAKVASSWHRASESFHAGCLYLPSASCLIAKSLLTLKKADAGRKNSTKSFTSHVMVTLGGRGEAVRCYATFYSLQLDRGRRLAVVHAFLILERTLNTPSPMSVN